MEMQTLKEFLQLTQTLNYTAAADRLFISRPTLSKHIKKLEEELGVELFERSTKSVALTKQGRILRERAYSIMHEYEAMLVELKGVQTISGTLRIGGCLRYPRINLAMSLEVSRFEHEYRDVEITMTDIYYRDYREPLMNGTFDLICSFRLPGLNEEGLDFIPLIDMEVCAWVSEDSVLANRKSTTYEELSSLVIRYMEPNRSKLLTSLYRDTFAQRGLHLNEGKPLTPTYFMERDEFCLFPLVSASVGTIPRIVQIPIEDPLKLSVCWVRKHKSINPIPKLFFEKVLSQ